MFETYALFLRFGILSLTREYPGLHFILGIWMGEIFIQFRFLEYVTGK